MIKQVIKMISSALLHSSVQEMQGMHPSAPEANQDYTQGQYFERIAQQHYVNNQQDLSLSDYRNAMWNFLSAALKGHKEAQYRLGLGYLHGELGLQKNVIHAEFWLKKAADQGHLPASNALNHTYEKIAFS